ncbi:MAG: prolyl oligopeptidase family serine peptidase [Salinisphaera sp.]|nr:prolyl oligopeptidase family serine peptidase [Salinisphaera sp.]
MKPDTPCGSWPSPIGADTVAAAGLKLGQTAVDGDRVYWSERRPQEGGRCTVMAITGGGDPQTLVPLPFDVRSAVHEYGGGAFAVAGGRLWFVNGDDQTIHVRERDGAVRPLTAAGKGLAFADLQPDLARERLIAVCEDHSGPGEASASLVAVDVRAGDITVLHRGRDFYASPRLSPDGCRLVWLAWDHPDMPWDSTELWQIGLDADGRPSPARRLAGGVGESLFAPVFAPDGVLHVVSDASGWWNICRLGPGGLVPVTAEQAEFGLPQWVFGQSTYGFDDDGKLYALMGRDSAWQLVTVADNGGLDGFDLPFTHLEQLRVGRGRLVFIAGNASTAPTLCRLGSDGRGLRRLRASVTSDWDETLVSIPSALTYPTADAAVAHGLYYPPRNPRVDAPSAAPPLLIKCHGGPTGATETALDLRIQFWTSRGFAVLDVNYRGSTGYCRAYREALYGAWGVADVADCVAGARHLADRRLADPARTVISGSSAGGYTVLCVLTFTKLAAAGASYYGIGDLAALLATTHKFESRYLKRLIGDEESLMHSRSPLFNAEQLSCPVLFLHGLKDKVVPPAQAASMAAALRARGLPVAEVRFPEERHGFRDAGNIAAAIGSELAFYGQMLGFAPADSLPPLRIDNWRG